MNLVADQVTMLASVRSLSDPALDRAIERIDRLWKKPRKLTNAAGEILWMDRIPAVLEFSGDDSTCEKVSLPRRAAKSWTRLPSLASEDFSRYRAFVPSFFYWVGSTAAGDEVQELHKPLFHTDDTALRHAAELYAASAMLPG